MFPNNSAGAIVPVAAAPLGPPFATEGERQATIRELMPYFLGYGKVELRWAAGTHHPATYSPDQSPVR